MSHEQTPWPRPRSVAGRAEGRRTIVGCTLALSPLVLVLVMLAAGAGGPWLAVAAIVGMALVFATVTVWDLSAWASATRAAWRMKRGQPPVAPHVDYGVGEDC